MVDDSCLFCRIVSGVAPAVVVYKDEQTLAFLDIRPLFHGHLLIVPRGHVETLGDLPIEFVEPLFTTVRMLSRAIETGMESEGSFVAINNRISQSVPHLHVHVVPRKKKDGLKGFFWPRTKYQSEEQMEVVKQLIVSAIDLDSRKG